MLQVLDIRWCRDNQSKSTCFCFFKPTFSILFVYITDMINQVWSIFIKADVRSIQRHCALPDRLFHMLGFVSSACWSVLLLHNIPQEEGGKYLSAPPHPAANYKFHVSSFSFPNTSHKLLNLNDKINCKCKDSYYHLISYKT